MPGGVFRLVVVRLTILSPSAVPFCHILWGRVRPYSHRRANPIPASCGAKTFLGENFRASPVGRGELTALRKLQGHARLCRPVHTIAEGTFSEESAWGGARTPSRAVSNSL